MTCIADGSPEPSITWYKDDKVILGQTLQFYYIPAVQLEDRGFYYCTAENTVPSNHNPSMLQLLRGVSEKVVINIQGEESN